MEKILVYIDNGGRTDTCFMLRSEYLLLCGMENTGIEANAIYPEHCELKTAEDVLAEYGD